MTALSADFARRRMGVDPVIAIRLAIGVAASTTIYKGSLVALNQAGNAVPASADASLHIVGVSEDNVDNSAGSAGALTCTPRKGVFYLSNSSSTDAITDADIGRFCYAADDNTAARTSSGGIRPVAGVVEGVDAFGVAVSVGLHHAGADGAIDVLFPAGADLSSTGQLLFVKLNGSSQVVLADTAGEAAMGVLQNAPASGAIARVRVQGISKVIAGGTLADVAILATTATTARAKAAVVATCDASGASATAAITGSFAMGRAHGDGTTGNAMMMLVQPMGIIPGTAA